MKVKYIVNILLFHGTIFNFIVEPSKILLNYKNINDIEYINEWLYSILFNLVAWQILDFYLKSKYGQKEGKSLKCELKYNYIIQFLHTLLSKLFQINIIRKLFLNFLIWYSLLCNIVLVIIVGIFFTPHKLPQFLLAALISFQFVLFAFFYYHISFPNEVNQSERKLFSPWLSDLFFTKN